MKLVRHALLLALLGAVTVLAPPGHPAGAGGSWMEPARDRYAAGEQATLVGYTGGGALGWVGDGPFFAYLVLEPEPPADGPPPLPGSSEPAPEPARLPLGEMEVQETGRPGWQAIRLAVTFTLPDDLAPGAYWVDYCNRECKTGIGDIVGGMVWVDVDPDGPIDRYWPADDPALRGEPAWVPLPPGSGPAEGPVPTTAVPAPTTAVPTTVATDPAPAPTTIPTRSAPDAETVATGGGGRPGSGSGVDPAALALVGAGVTALLVAAVLLVRRRRSPRPGGAPRPPVPAGAPVAGVR